MLKAEDPYASMEKDLLISMIHFLVKREEERAQENQEMKDMVTELRDYAGKNRLWEHVTDDHRY